MVIIIVIGGALLLLLVSVEKDPERYQPLVLQPVKWASWALRHQPWEAGRGSLQERQRTLPAPPGSLRPSQEREAGGGGRGAEGACSPTRRAARRPYIIHCQMGLRAALRGGVCWGLTLRLALC